MEEKLNALNETLIKLEAATNFPHDQIRIRIENEYFAIDIEDETWDNYLHFDEVIDILTDLFRGIALGKGIEWRYRG